MTFANWFPMDECYFYKATELSRSNFCCPSGETVIEIATDAEELLLYYTQHNDVGDVNRKPDATLIYALDPNAYVKGPFGKKILRKPPTFDFYDAAIDLVQCRVLFAGIQHYGLFKSIVAGLASFVMASESRQGLHAGAFAIRGRGILLAGGAGAGKTALFLRLIDHLTSVSTEDWCDVCLTEYGVEAIGLERNLSVNIDDLEFLVNQEVLPRSVFTLQPIPHGHREKIVLPLKDICVTGICQRVAVSNIFVICNVNEPQIVKRVTGEKLYDMLTTISTHQPLCTPIRTRVDLYEDIKMLEEMEKTEQLERALMINANRMKFCIRLASLITEGKCSLCLLPLKRDEGSLTRAVNVILGGVSV